MGFRSFSARQFMYMYFMYTDQTQEEDSAVLGTFRVLTAVTASNSTVFLDVVPFIVGTILLRVRGKLTASVLRIVNLEDEDSRLLRNVCQFIPNYTRIKFKKTQRFLFRV
jgi:hypothetical protein